MRATQEFPIKISLFIYLWVIKDKKMSKNYFSQFQFRQNKKIISKNFKNVVPPKKFTRPGKKFKIVSSQN